MNYAFRAFPVNNRSWNILCSNVRGINATDKCDAVREKIEECACFVIESI
jgi:hypothetical protein